MKRNVQQGAQRASRVVLGTSGLRACGEGALHTEASMKTGVDPSLPSSAHTSFYEDRGRSISTPT